MKTAFDNLAELVGRVLADRWLRHESQRRGRRGSGDGTAAARLAALPAADEPHATTHEQQAAVDVHDTDDHHDDHGDDHTPSYEQFVHW